MKRLLLLIATFLSPISLLAQKPELFLMDESRLSEIRSLVAIPFTPDYEAFETMKAEAHSGDSFLAFGSYTNYKLANFKRAFYARELAFIKSDGAEDYSSERGTYFKKYSIL